MLRRRTFVRLAARLLATAALAAGTAAAEAPRLQPQPAPRAWIELPAGVAERWSVEGDPGRDDHLSLTPRGRTANRRVIVLVPKPSPAYDTAAAALLDAFDRWRAPPAVDLVYFALDRGRALRWLELARGGGYDLLLAMGSQSAEVVHEDFLGAAVPVVTVTAKDPVLMGQLADYQTPGGSNVAYTSLDVPVSVQLAYLERLLPDLARVVVLTARDNPSAVRTQAEPFVAEARRRGLDTRLVVLGHQPRRELARRLPRIVGDLLAADPDGRTSVLWITVASEVFLHMDLIDEIAGPVPIVAASPDLVEGGGHGPVMAVGVRFESNARLAAAWALRILDGVTTAGELPAGLLSPPDLALDLAKARQLGLAVPFSLFEAAGTVFDPHGAAVRRDGRPVAER